MQITEPKHTKTRLEDRVLHRAYLEQVASWPCVGQAYYVLIIFMKNKVSKNMVD